MKSVLNENTGELLYLTVVDVELGENEILLDDVPQSDFVKAFYNFETGEFYEGATPEQITEVNKPKVPQEVTRLQFLMALNSIGVKEQNLYDFVELIEDENTRYLAKLQLKNCLTFNRNNQMLNDMAPAFGLSQGQLDELFIIANEIQL